MSIKFIKTRNVKSPERGTPKSAGIDFFVPELTHEYLYDVLSANYENPNIDDNYLRDSFIRLQPGHWISLPSGICVELPEGYALLACNKSGNSVRFGVDKLAELIDEDYQGEIHLVIHNNSSRVVEIKGNAKLLQFIPIKMHYPILTEVTDWANIFQQKTERGENGFGHTG